MIYYSGVYFKCDFSLLVISVQEAVNQGKHKFEGIKLRKLLGINLF